MKETKKREKNRAGRGTRSKGPLRRSLGNMARRTIETQQQWYEGGDGGDGENGGDGVGWWRIAEFIGFRDTRHCGS